MCGAIREIIESSLKTVTSCMNYAITVCYQLAFECPSHLGRDHLCVVDSKETSPHMMDSGADPGIFRRGGQLYSVRRIHTDKRVLNADGIPHLPLCLTVSNELI